MSISASGLRALSWPFVSGFLVLWNGLHLSAVWLNGGPRNYHDPRALCLVFLACMVTACTALAIVILPGFRRLVVAPKRAHHYEPAPFLFIAVLTGFLGATAVPW